MEDILLRGDEHEVLLEHLSSLEKQHNVKISVPGCEISSVSCDVIFASIQGDEEGINAVKQFLSQKSNELVFICEAERSVNKEVPVITLSDSDNETPNKVKLKKKKRRKTYVDLTSSSDVIKDESDCDVHTSTKAMNHKKRRLCVPELEFIPLNAKRVPEKTRMPDSPPNTDDDDIVIEETPVARPILRDPSRLRHVVIDGSNVAREHGKKDNTFSCKGIQICVEYFLKRGHTEVTTFVPNFRRHCRGRIPTTDQDILENLAKSQHVVFTPSRRVKGKTISSYDDRFIVQLASQKKGVILSNDHYNDLIDVNEDFKKTIEERLLMFCFVGDILMIPDDPLGRDGPKLEEFLMHPAEE